MAANAKAPAVKPRKGIKRPKKSALKVRARAEEETYKEAGLIDLRREEAREINELENLERVERSKRLVMWSGVTFFMLVIVVVWVLNIKSVFQAVPSTGNDMDWQEITNNVSKSLEEAKKSVEEIKGEALDIASTSPEALFGGRAASSTPADNSTLSVDDQSGVNAIATTSPGLTGETDMRALKNRIDELEKKLNSE